MRKGDTEVRVEMPGTISEHPRRNSGETDGGASNPVAEKWTPDDGQTLLEEVLGWENVDRAVRKVIRNGGAPGIDGMTTQDLWLYMDKNWSGVRKQLLEGTYTPSPVKGVLIPKPDGGWRQLGIPTVVDRMIQQALLQKLEPKFDPKFSESSYGFRKGRGALDAVRKAREYVAGGCQWVVDTDLAKFFDRVNHDILMSRLARRIQDRKVLRLIRLYLKAGLMQGGLVSPRTEGTPQGGPLSPLLSNIMLDELDKELERRGHHFCRYADDCNIYVRSKKAGERVFLSVRKFLENKLRLQVNEQKSSVNRPWKLKFLGYTMTLDWRPKLRPSGVVVKRFKRKINEVYGRGRGWSFADVLKALNPKIRGFASYFQLSDVRKVWEGLDEWIRHKLRCLIWQRWKKPKTRRGKLLQYGLNEDEARLATSNGRGAWWNSHQHAMHEAFTNRKLQKYGLLSLTQVIDNIQRRKALVG